MSQSISLTLNGEAITDVVADEMLAVDWLREQRGLTGTHVGCDTSQCGACTIHVDGMPVKACTTLAAQLAARSVTTIEGLARGTVLHPMQQAFQECHGLQCGFCTPGMVMAGIGIVERAAARGAVLDEATVRHELEGNLCRCTGYQHIVDAILSGGRAMMTRQAAE